MHWIFLIFAVLAAVFAGLGAVSVWLIVMTMALKVGAVVIVVMGLYLIGMYIFNRRKS